jgi:hypothetical protein
VPLRSTEIRADFCASKINAKVQRVPGRRWSIVNSTRLRDLPAADPAEQFGHPDRARDLLGQNGLTISTRPASARSVTT